MSFSRAWTKSSFLMTIFSTASGSISKLLDSWGNRSKTTVKTNALLHQAIFCATCVTTFKSVALQLHEQRCYTVQWDWQQLAKLRPRRTEESIIRILIGWSSKHCETSCTGGGLHCATMKRSINSLLQSLGIVESNSTFCNASSNNFSATCDATKSRDKLQETSKEWALI